MKTSPSFVLIAAALALASCGDTPTEPVNEPAPIGPATVVMDSASIRVGALRREVLTLSLRNTGAAGSFKVQAWGLPTTPNGPSTLYGESEPTNVAAGWRQALNYDITTGSTGQTPSVKWALVFSRDEQNVVWRQTGRRDFP